MSSCDDDLTLNVQILFQSFPSTRGKAGKAKNGEKYAKGDAFTVKIFKDAPAENEVRAALLSTQQDEDRSCVTVAVYS